MPRQFENLSKCITDSMKVCSACRSRKEKNMSKIHRLALLVLVLTAISFALVLAPGRSVAEPPAPQAVQVIPQPVLTFSEGISEWSMTSGFIYLTDTCTDFSTETSAYIRRRAIHSTIMRRLESINAKPQCRTFRYAATDESGIYYYNRNLGRIEAIYSDAPTDPPTPLATIGDRTEIGSGNGVGISTLRTDRSYVYWIEVRPGSEFRHDEISIKRVSKKGGTVSTRISYTTAKGASFYGLGITSSHIWWIDSDGLNRIDSCTLRGCAPGPVTKTVEFPIASLSEGYIQVSGSSVFWWKDNENPERIRRTRCSFVSGNCSTSTFYTAGSNTSIAGLAAGGGAAFWVEHVSPSGSRLRRKAVSNGTAETLAEGILFSAPYVDVDGVYFRQDRRTIARLPFDTDALTREFSVNAWEVTQGIQRPANDVPRVAGKPTFVRLYPTLDDGVDVGALTAELHGSSDGRPLPGSPIYPLNGAIPVPADLSLADRVNLDGGWLFRLPDSWIRTGEGSIPQTGTSITLRAVIDPSGVYADSDNPDNNEISDEFRFIAKAPTCVTLRPVITHSPYQPVYGFNISQVLALTDSILPTANLIPFPKNDPLRETDWCWKGPFYGPFCSSPYELSDDDSGLLTKMGWLDFWQDSPDICFYNNARTLYGGIIHEKATWDWSGLARRGKDQFLTKVPKYGGDPISRRNGTAMTMVHEIGHNYGRKHIDCGDPKRPDPNYPYPEDMLDFGYSLNHPDLHFGFDPLRMEPISPLSTKDFMSYCGPKWYSDYTWKAIFNNTRDPVYVPPPPTTASATGDIVRIAGLINAENGSGSLDYAWAVSPEMASASQWQSWSNLLAQAQTLQSAGSRYHIQLIGDGGQVLADQDIELDEIEDGEEQGPTPFEVVMDGPAEAVARIQLMEDQTVLASLYPGTGEPSIVIDLPAGGTMVGDEITIRWTASDPDGDQLFYTIQYSANGGDGWVPLLANYGGTGSANESITLDISAEAGTDGASGLVRVLTSDGYNTAMATSQPFTVARRRPFAAISNPGIGHIVAISRTVTLQGYASDPEDGIIADDLFVWSTGQRGQTADIIGLAPGPQTIQLTVTDADGLDSSTSVSFTVAPLAVPETDAAFLLDGRCDDEGYQNAPQLPLTPYAGGSRASARIIHSSSRMWLCLSGLQDTGGYAGLLVDADNSGEPTVQPGDFGYFIQPDGTRFVREGNGVGFDSADAGSFSARMVDYGVVWSAELRISRSAFGSWQERVSLAIGHFGQNGNAATAWPSSAEMTSPQSWGQTNLGLAATLAGVTPESAVLDGTDIQLTVSGADFDADHIVLWDGSPLPTTLVDANTLSASVPANLIVTAGNHDVSVGVADKSGLTTAALPFTALTPQPAISALSPDTAEMGSGGRTVTIDGSGFVDGASVVWNGEQRATTFVNASQLRFEIVAADLAGAISVPVVVLNPEPSAGPSNMAVFDISSGLQNLFLPLLQR